MFFTALGQQVQHPSAGGDNPIDASFVIYEPQDLDPILETGAARPIIDLAHRFLLTLRNPGGGDFDAIYP